MSAKQLGALADDEKVFWDIQLGIMWQEYKQMKAKAEEGN
jgi:hypothetical protein